MIIANNPMNKYTPSLDKSILVTAPKKANTANIFQNVLKPYSDLTL